MLGMALWRQARRYRLKNVLPIYCVHRRCDNNLLLLSGIEKIWLNSGPLRAQSRKSNHEAQHPCLTPGGETGFVWPDDSAVQGEDWRGHGGYLHGVWWCMCCSVDEGNMEAEDCSLAIRKRLPELETIGKGSRVQ